MRIASILGLAKLRLANAGTANPPRYLRRLVHRVRALPYAALSTTAVLLFAGAAHATAPTGCNISDVVAHALPSVVNISVVRVLSRTESGQATYDHFELFVGSGAIVDPSGLIVTNKHVIQDAAIIRVTFQNRETVSAQLVAAAAYTDLAVLKVNMPKPLPALSFGDSDALKIGQPAIAVGNPLGIGTSVSTGVISGVNRNLMRTPFDDYVQTDASINPGNSGGPLLDCSGHIIGIDTALLSNNSTLGSIGLGFALPANDVEFVVGILRDPSRQRPNWIGLHAQDLTSLLASVFGLPGTDGAIVTGIEPNSPAARASLQRGDIIIGINGVHPRDSREVQRTIVHYPEGTPVKLTVWRDDETVDLTVKGEPWPNMLALRSEVLASKESIARAEDVGLGMYVANIIPADRERYGLGDTTGVLIDQVVPGSQAEDMGLTAGDVIQQINQEPTTSVDQVTRLLMMRDTSEGHLVAMLVQSPAGPKWVTLWAGGINPRDLVSVTSPGSGEEAHGEAHGEAHEVSAKAPQPVGGK
jgi:serine protease Do